MKGCLRTIFFVIVIYNVLHLLISFLGGAYTYDFVAPACDEFVQEDQLSRDRTHQREWRIPDVSESFCVGYNSSEAMNQFAAERRATVEARYSDANFWGSIYGQLVDQTESQLDYLVDSLMHVAKSRAYEPADLAKLTVSFVQDIPYSFVIPRDCAEFKTDGKPCLGFVDYGIISPYEFVHTLMGDCDTRAVLLYVLLQRMGFDPMIVVSDEYAHAMLALNIPAQGDYLRHDGKKYYFWETTATGWSIGMLPPDTNNKDYWKIALVNES